MKNNFFVTKLLDIIIAKDESEPLSEARGIFLVMDYEESDVRKLIKESKDGDISETHIRVLLYNLLCSLNYIHSAKVMHRDIKPANLLLDSNCQVKVCDFGLARTFPKKD